MATIPTSYTPTDGAVFDTAGHNQNLYSATGSEGIYSESNGGLNDANLKTGFRILAEHILPNSMLFAAHREGHQTLHYYSDMMGSASGTKYISVDAVRFRLPFNASAMKISVSFFVSPYLWFDNNGAAIHDARTQVWFDGLAQAESEYLLPVAARGITAVDYNHPGRFAIQRTHNLLLTDASALTKGDHEVSLRLYIKNAPTAATLWPVFAGTYDVKESCTLHGRVTIGAVSIVALAYKKANS